MLKILKVSGIEQFQESRVIVEVKFVLSDNPLTLHEKLRL